MRTRVIPAALVAIVMAQSPVLAQSGKPAFCTRDDEFQDRIHAFQQCIAEHARDMEAGEDDLNIVADKAVASCAALKDPLIDFISLCSGDNGVMVIGRQGDTFHLWGVEAGAAFRDNRLGHLEKST